MSPRREWIDQASQTCAANWTGDCRVSADVERVEVRAKRIQTGRTGRQVAIDICAGNLKQVNRAATFTA